MRTRPNLASFLALGLFSWCALAVRPAAAQSSSCSSDSECVKGWSCQVTGGSGCGYACAPGQDCSPPPDCVTQEFKSCVPGACHADSDCADGMACYTHSESICADTACSSSDGKCPPPACDTKTSSECVPRYLLPCKVAADCGAGFNCVESAPSCTCSGGAASNGSGSAGGSSSGGSPTPPPADAGPTPAPSPTPDPAPGCTCAPAQGRSCSALPVTCTSNTDCAAGWTCETVNSPSDCASAPANPPGGGVGGGAPTPASDPCPPTRDVKQCAPPYFSLVHGSLDSSSGVIESGLPGNKGAGAGAGGASSSTPIPPTAAPGSGPGATSSAAGCTVAFRSGAGGAGAGALLFALGLFGVLRRRRATAAAR